MKKLVSCFYLKDFGRKEHLGSEFTSYQRLTLNYIWNLDTFKMSTVKCYFGNPNIVFLELHRRHTALGAQTWMQSTLLQVQGGGVKQLDTLECLVAAMQRVCLSASFPLLLLLKAINELEGPQFVGKVNLGIDIKKIGKHRIPRVQCGIVPEVWRTGRRTQSYRRNSKNSLADRGRRWVTLTSSTDLRWMLVAVAS